MRYSSGRTPVVPSHTAPRLSAPATHPHAGNRGTSGQRPEMAEGECDRLPLAPSWRRRAILSPVSHRGYYGHAAANGPRASVSCPSLTQTYRGAGTQHPVARSSLGRGIDPCRSCPAQRRGRLGTPGGDVFLAIAHSIMRHMLRLTRLVSYMFAALGPAALFFRWQSRKVQDTYRPLDVIGGHELRTFIGHGSSAWWRNQQCMAPTGATATKSSNHRKPMDSHGNAATMMRATISVKMYGQIRQIASSGEILPMAHAP